MPSVHKVLKLQAARVRASAQSRLLSRVTKNENSDAAPQSLSSSSFPAALLSETSFSSADFDADLGRSASAGASLSPALAGLGQTPSEGGARSGWGEACPGVPDGRARSALSLGRKLTFAISGQAPETFGRDVGNSAGGMKDLRKRFAALRPEAWKEESGWATAALSELEERAIENDRWDAERRSADRFSRFRLERGASYGEFQDPPMTGAIGRAGIFRSRRAGIFVHRSTGITGGFSARAFHDASLAGEGAAVPESERHSDQSASGGKSLKLLSAACNLPHPDKVKTGGEDAYFIRAEEHAFGVADGVGGWADLGIDAGEYARELMSQASIAVGQEPPGGADPAHVLEKAHSLTKCRGSSTACILSLTDGTLAAASLGDSGFVVVRDCRRVFKSPPQQHQFNIPFQLENGGSDPPSAAQVFSLQVCVGDVIVAGTDGLFDNLYDSELTTIIVQALRGGTGPQVAAQKIAALARSRAQDKNRQTPFSTAAQDAGFRFYGGKMDDITVIVSYITNSKSVSSRL